MVQTVDEYFVQLDKYVYWSRLVKAHQDWALNEGPHLFSPNIWGFKYWMLKKWGVLIELEDETYGPEYQVVDGRKYILFCLKYE